MVTGMSLSARLTDAGFSLETLGLFALVGLPYAFKVLWAPLIETLPLPFLTEKLGQRRAWAVLAQIGLLLSYAGMAFVGPESHIVGFAVLCLALSFFSATQDVALDGYRIAWLEKNQQAFGAGLFVNCYRLALMVSGAGAVIVSDHVGWSSVMLGLMGFQGLGVLAVLTLPFQSIVVSNNDNSWFFRAFLRPLQGLKSHRGWLGFLAIVLTFRLPDAYLASMNYRFLYDTGFSKAEIASVVQIYGLSAAFVGGLLGGWLMQRLGLYRALIVAAALQMLSNLSYAWIDGPLLSQLVPVMTLEELASGIATASFLGFLALLCQKEMAATQYALLTSLMALTRMLVSSTSGIVASALGWNLFFVMSAMLGFVGLGLVLVMRPFFRDLMRD
jgi:PAT family beta-lactamase induction signal transducer AmpG